MACMHVWLPSLCAWVLLLTALIYLQGPQNQLQVVSQGSRPLGQSYGGFQRNYRQVSHHFRTLQHRAQ